MSRETRYELRGSLATNVIREADDQTEGSSFFSPPLLSFLPLNRISPLDLDPGNVSPAEKPTFFPFFFFSSFSSTARLPFSQGSSARSARFLGTSIIQRSSNGGAFLRDRFVNRAENPGKTRLITRIFVPSGSLPPSCRDSKWLI